MLRHHASDIDCCEQTKKRLLADLQKNIRVTRDYDKNKIDVVIGSEDQVTFTFYAGEPQL